MWLLRKTLNYEIKEKQNINVKVKQLFVQLTTEGEKSSSANCPAVQLYSVQLLVACVCVVVWGAGGMGWFVQT